MPENERDDNPGQNAWVTTQITEFLRAFQRIEVLFPSPGPHLKAHVHPPYMLLSTSLLDRPDAQQYLQEHHWLRLKNARAAREAASPAVRDLLAKHFYDGRGSEKNIARGRAGLKAIQALLQEALNQGLVPPGQGSGEPGGQDLRAWLKRYGIGVDCSGFVQQTLQHLRDARQGEAGPEVPFLRCPRVYRAITAGSPPLDKSFTQIPLPRAARPGDVLVSLSHMRILVQVEPAPRGGCIFHLAESTSARDIPAGGEEEETDIGPRAIQVMVPAPDRPFSDQLPAWKREWETAYRPEENERSYRIARYIFG